MFKPHFIRRSLAGVLVVVAAAFPVAAQARYIEDPGAPSASPALTAGSQPPSQVAAVPPNPTGGSSFQWGDAGIGAAGAAVMLGAAALAARATRRRRRAAVS